MGYDGVGYYLRHPWFEKSDPAYRLSPWADGCRVRPNGQVPA